MPVKYFESDEYPDIRWANQIGKKYSSNTNQINGGVMSQYLFELQNKVNFPYIVYITQDDLYICTDKNGML